MKNSPIYIVFLFLLLSCTSEKKELYKETDAFINSLEVFRESYGMLGGGSYSVTTSDGKYKITPFGKLIKIKIQTEPNPKEYENLRNELISHFQNNERVEKVFIAKNGPLLIDVRKLAEK